MIDAEVFMKKEYTGRMFGIVYFNDNNGIRCTIQESSSCEKAKIWLGAESADPQYRKPGTNGWTNVDMPEEYIANNRMHLSKKEVLQILPFLLKFLITGKV